MLTFISINDLLNSKLDDTKKLNLLTCRYFDYEKEIHSIDALHCKLHCVIERHFHCKTEHCVFPSYKDFLCRGCYAQSNKLTVIDTLVELKRELGKYHPNFQDKKCKANCSEPPNCGDLCAVHCDLKGHSHCIGFCFEAPEIGSYTCYNCIGFKDPNPMQIGISNLNPFGVVHRKCSPIEIKFGTQVVKELKRQLETTRYNLYLFREILKLDFNFVLHVALCYYQHSKHIISNEYFCIDQWTILSSLLLAFPLERETLLALEKECLKFTTNLKVQNKIHDFICERNFKY